MFTAEDAEKDAEKVEMAVVTNATGTVERSIPPPGDWIRRPKKGAGQYGNSIIPHHFAALTAANHHTFDLIPLRISLRPLRPLRPLR